MPHPPSKLFCQLLAPPCRIPPSRKKGLKSSPSAGPQNVRIFERYSNIHSLSPFASPRQGADNDLPKFLNSQTMHDCPRPGMSGTRTILVTRTHSTGPELARCGVRASTAQETGRCGRWSGKCSWAGDGPYDASFCSHDWPPHDLSPGDLRQLYRFCGRARYRPGPRQRIFVWTYIGAVDHVNQIGWSGHTSFPQGPAGIPSISHFRSIGCFTLP